jgi:beta-1,4-mannosyl-glycoprotein beta-1,4-N-acetylglucosaminyltransferase
MPLLKGEAKHKRGEKLILNGMARDYYQRESLLKGIKEAEENDLIIISDLDEIPNLNQLNFNEIGNNIVIFEQKMFYYKLNLFYEDYIWQGTKAVKRKNFISPQWLRNIKGKKYSKWRLDTFFSKKKYSNLLFVKNGGWHFTCLKSPEELEKKLLNFAHHYEFEESGLKLDDIKKLIKDKRVMYDHTVDQKGYKWSGKSILKNLDSKFLPDHVSSNLGKYSDWLD